MAEKNPYMGEDRTSGANSGGAPYNGKNVGGDSYYSPAGGYSYYSPGGGGGGDSGDAFYGYNNNNQQHQLYPAEADATPTPPLPVAQPAHYYSAPPGGAPVAGVPLAGAGGRPNYNNAGAWAPHATPERWHYGLCEACGAVGACCEALWCPYCTMSRVYNKMENDVADVHGLVCVGLACVDCYLCGFCVGVGCAACAGAAYNRYAVRLRYGIDADPRTGRVTVSASDVMSGLCCLCCSNAQVLLEMSARGDCPGAYCCEASLPRPKAAAPMA